MGPQQRNPTSPARHRQVRWHHSGKPYRIGADQVRYHDSRFGLWNNPYTHNRDTCRSRFQRKSRFENPKVTLQPGIGNVALIFPRTSFHNASPKEWMSEFSGNHGDCCHDAAIPVSQGHRMTVRLRRITPQKSNHTSEANSSGRQEPFMQSALGFQQVSPLLCSNFTRNIAKPTATGQYATRYVTCVATILMVCSTGMDSWAQAVVTSEAPSQLAATQRQYGLDPEVPLIQRIGETTDSVLSIFHRAGMSPKPYSPSEDDRQKLVEAIAILPPLHQSVLKQRLRNLSLLNDMPNTALTSTVNSDEPSPLFDVAIRAAILQQSASEWMAEKESSCFSGNESRFSLRVDVGSITAIQYVLLHEATHIVDATQGITPSLDSNPSSSPQGVSTPFTAGIWEDLRTPVHRYVDEGLMAIRFRPGGKIMDCSQMKVLYEALGRTPFVSLYGSSARTEDLAEYLTVYHVTQKLNQPFSISVYDGAQKVLRHDPMTSEIVRKRFDLMRQFYEPKE